eukprot:12901433-Prorocentrum_lima.AAC.1
MEAHGGGGSPIDGGSPPQLLAHGGRALVGTPLKQANDCTDRGDSGKGGKSAGVCVCLSSHPLR